MREKSEYVAVKPRSREELDAAFESDEEDAICNAMYSAAQHEQNWRWVQGELIKFLSHKSLRVRSTAINALGELVLFRGHIDLEAVLPEMNKLANDPDVAPLVKKYHEDLKIRVKIN